MEQQEYLIKLQMLEQQASQFGEQLRAIDQQTSELNNLKRDLKKLDESKEKDMFSEIGKGIYIKASLEKKEMLVDVGNKVLVPKSPKEIHGIVDSQIKKFDDVKIEISRYIDQINEEVNNLIMEVNKPEKKSEKKIVKKR